MNFQLSNDNQLTKQTITTATAAAMAASASATVAEAAGGEK